MSTNRSLALNECKPAAEIPFSLDEYQQRLLHTRKRMHQDGIDLLYLTAPESMFYLCGYTCEWYQAQSPKQWPATSGIAVHVNHDNIILFDTPSEQIMVRFVSIARDVRIFPMTSRRDGIAFILNELASAAWLTGTVGLEFHSYRPNPAISKRFVAGFESAGCRVVDGSDVLRELRWIKSPQEMSYIKQAAKIMDVGLTAARDTIAPGLTELEVYGEVIRAMAHAGGENPGIPIPVLSGPKANCGHALASRKKITHGEQVNVDVCGVFNRYHCNAARSFYIGEPAAEIIEFYEKSSKAFDVLRDILHPHLTVGTLVSTLQEYYKDIGIWGDASWVGGYEMGLAFPPDWVGNFVYEFSDIASQRQFVPGTAVNYESVFYGPHKTGLTYLIDTLLFDENSAQLASQMPRHLTVID